VDLIDRVEIIRGPGSSLYGNNAFLAVINVITRNGAGMPGLGGEVSGEAATRNTYKGRVTFGHQFTNGLELLLSGTIFNSEGNHSLYYPQFDQRISANTRATNNGVAEDADADEYKSGFGRIAFHDFSLQGAYIRREKEDPTAPNFVDFNDDRMKTTDERSYVNLKYAHAFEDIVDVTAQVYYDRHEYEAVYPFQAQGFTVISDQQLAEWWGAELQLTKKLFDRHTITLGGEYRDDFRQEETFVDKTTGAPTQPTDDRDRQNYGIYLQGDFAILTNLHLNAGIRYDKYGDFDPDWNPRLALIYNPIGQTVLKAMYGTAFRAPNFYETRPNPTAPIPNPETITTYELVYEQGIGDHLRSSVAGFYNEIDDPIVLQGVYQNLEGAKSKGVELSLDGFWKSGIRGRASYTYQEAEDEATHDWLSNSPRHLGKLQVSVPLWKDKVFGGLEFIYVSRRETDLGTSAGDYSLLNFTIFSHNIVKGLEFSVGVYNLLDREFDDPAPQSPFPHLQDVIPQDGRSFRVKLTYRF
jgi:iron complex outermembrane receptor protein